MKESFRSYGEICTVEYENSLETKEALFQKMKEFFFKHHAFSGESVCQCDGPQIEAQELLSEIADEIFKFKSKWEVATEPTPREG